MKLFIGTFVLDSHSISHEPFLMWRRRKKSTSLRPLTPKPSAPIPFTSLSHFVPLRIFEMASNDACTLLHTQGGSCEREWDWPCQALLRLLFKIGGIAWLEAEGLLMEDSSPSPYPESEVGVFVILRILKLFPSLITILSRGEIVLVIWLLNSYKMLFTIFALNRNFRWYTTYVWVVTRDCMVINVEQLVHEQCRRFLLVIVSIFPLS